MNNEPNERQTILITGSTGLIGSHLIEALAPRYRVIGMFKARPSSIPTYRTPSATRFEFRMRF